MRTGLSEALDIFEKWRSEGSLLRCQMAFKDYAVSLSGRIRQANENEVRLSSDDKLSELVLRLDHAVSFGYGDSRNVPENFKTYDSLILVFFTEVLATGTPESVAFAEIREGESE